MLTCLHGHLGLDVVVLRLYELTQFPRLLSRNLEICRTSVARLTFSLLWSTLAQDKIPFTYNLSSGRRPFWLLRRFVGVVFIVMLDDYIYF